MDKLTKLPLKSRYQIIKKYKVIYQNKNISKKEKSKILKTIVDICGFNKFYACYLLNKKYKEKRIIKRNKTKIYDKKVLKEIIRFWKLSSFSCGKLLKPQIKTFLPFYEREYSEIEKKVKLKLLTISPATIDRLLKSEKKRQDYQRLKARSYLKKKDKFLENLIPIKTHIEWNFAIDSPGKLQIDLVSHDGGIARGDFIQTLNMVDYKTGWNVAKACLNKAASNVFPQLKKGISLFPFKIIDIHSDSGREFINAHLFRFCKKNNIAFTRSRPYKKDDNFWVENRNDKTVRQNVGYRRYEGKTDFIILNLLYEKLYLYLNFFKPQRRCIKKIKIGARTKKFYDKPQTSYQRVLHEKSVTKKQKQKLINIYRHLNPILLQKEILKLKNILLENDKIKKEFVKRLTKNIKKY